MMAVFPEEQATVVYNEENEERCKCVNQEIFAAFP